MAGEWREVFIEDIADVVGGSTPSTADPSNFDGEIPWLTPKDLSGPHPRYVQRGERNLSAKGLASCSAQLLPPNTILLSSRAPIGYLAIAANPLATNQGFRNLIVKPGYDHEFLYYWISANVEELERYASGSTFKELSGSALKKIKVRPPEDLREQRAIAHILGTLDDKIELNRRMSETLEAMARALFKAWFVDFEPVRAKMEGRVGATHASPLQPGLPAHLYDLFPDRLVESELGEIPEGWEVRKLPDLFDFLEGPGLRNWQYRDEGIKFLNIRCISDGDVDIAKANCISREEFKEKYLHFALKEDDVVISTSGTLGRLAVVRDDHLPIMLNTSIIRFRGLGAVGLTYVWGFLRSIYFLGEMQALASGSVQLNFGPMHLRQISVIQPSETALHEFECAAQPLLRKSLSLRKQSRTLAALRDTLLPKLISGELRVKDAEAFLKERGL